MVLKNQIKKIRKEKTKNQEDQKRSHNKKIIKSGVMAKQSWITWNRCKINRIVNQKDLKQIKIQNQAQDQSQ